jgi:hypothetical protein
MNINKWDAKDYQADSEIRQQWARELIAKLELKGTEKVLETGYSLTGLSFVPRSLESVLSFPPQSGI